MRKDKGERSAIGEAERKAMPEDRARREPRQSDRDLGRRINRAYMKERWAEAAGLIRRALAKTPRDHWLVTRLASVYYERRQYRRAYELSRRAMAMAPRCPLVLWDYAGVLRMLGRHKDSIAVLQKLIRRGPLALASEECGEGIVRARALVNDSRYEIARNYEDVGNMAVAKRYLEAYLKGRENGPRGIFSKRKAARRLRLLGKRMRGR